MYRQSKDITTGITSLILQSQNDFNRSTYDFIFEMASATDGSFCSIGLVVFLILIFSGTNTIRAEDCRLTPVVHVLQSPGCHPMKIPSFACVGKCTSYVQVSGSKLWQMERSCMCCQESGEREAIVTLNCENGSSGPRFQKVVTKAPVECMCRPCTAILDETSILPQEMVGLIDSDSLPSGSFAIMSRRL